MKYISKLAYKSGPTDTSGIESITSRARTTITSIRGTLAASLTTFREGARGGHSRTESPASDKPQRQSVNQSIRQVDDDGAAQVLRHRDEPVDDRDAAPIIDEDSFPNPNHRPVRLACNETSDGHHVLFDQSDARFFDGELGVDSDAWIAFDPDCAADLEGAI